MPQQIALHLAPWQYVDARERQRAPEGGLRPAVGEAAAVRDGRAVVGEPVPEVAGEPGRPLLEAVAAGQRVVEQAVEVHGPRDVVVAAFGGAVRVPAVTEPETLQAVEARGDQRTVVG